MNVGNFFTWSGENYKAPFKISNMANTATGVMVKAAHQKPEDMRHKTSQMKVGW